MMYLSFCTNTFQNKVLRSSGCLKPRMWAQYGENHHGVCFIFSKQKLVRMLENKPSFSIFHDSVVYDDSLNIPSGNLHIDSNISLPEIIQSHVKKNYKELLFTKPLDYRDENEYRIIWYNENAAQVSPPTISVIQCLEGIILGEKFSEAYFPVAKKASIKFDIPLKRIQWHDGNYHCWDVTE